MRHRTTVVEWPSSKCDFQDGGSKSGANTHCRWKSSADERGSDQGLTMIACVFLSYPRSSACIRG